MSKQIEVDEVVIKGVTYVPKSCVESFTNEGLLTKTEEMKGKNYFIRTVNYHFTGQVVDIIDDKFLVLQGSAWIADSGRFMQFIKDGDLNEIEPIGEHYINFNMVVDFIPWKHNLPKVQK